MSSRKLKIYENDTEVSNESCIFVIGRANKAIEEKGIFTIGVSGGSVGKFLCSGLPSLTTDWSKWRVFFCDERHVGFDHPECTFSYYQQNLMSKVPLSEDNVIADDPSLSVDEAAIRYEKKICDTFHPVDGTLPQFDLLMLGMGPDGHTCSLFPGHPLLKESIKLVAPIADSPKPPPERITMTMPLVNAAHCAVFISCGAGKAEMVQRVLEGTDDPPLPASQVQPSGGDLYWFLDKPAARLLTTAQL